MDPVSPIPALAALLIALATSSFFVKIFGITAPKGRYASIDGLRGIIAFFVFLHHSSVWYFYIQNSRWQAPPSNLYKHFGPGSVALFFMITDFLFFSKLIDGRVKAIDWHSLFVSRFMRLTPLYFFVVFLLLTIVVYVSHGTLKEPLWQIFKKIVIWLGFTVLGTPSINEVPIIQVVAGVVWSLPYEWFFYFALPVLSLAVGVNPPWRYKLLGIASIIGLIFWHAAVPYLMCFFGGIVASIFVRWGIFCRFATKKTSTLIVLTCLALVVGLYPDPFEFVPLMLLSVAFIIVACGNDIFGLLNCISSRALGEVSYSIYLLHGLLLFVTFNFVGYARVRELPALMYWIFITGLTPILISLCFVTFRVIERPAMRRAPIVTNWLRICSRSNGPIEKLIAVFANLHVRLSS